MGGRAPSTFLLEDSDASKNDEGWEKSVHDEGLGSLNYFSDLVFLVNVVTVIINSAHGELAFGGVVAAHGDEYPEDAVESIEESGKVDADDAKDFNHDLEALDYGLALVFFLVDQIQLHFVIENTKAQGQEGQSIEFVCFVDVEIRVGEGRMAKSASPDQKIETNEGT